MVSDFRPLVFAVHQGRVEWKAIGAGRRDVQQCEDGGVDVVHRGPLTAHDSPGKGATAVVVMMMMVSQQTR